MTDAHRNRRIRWLALGMVGVFLAILARLFQIQQVEPESFSARGDQFRTQLAERIRRGTIVDRRGRELAISTYAYSLYVDPSYYRQLLRLGRFTSEELAQRKATLARILSEVLNVPLSEVASRLDSPRAFEWVRRWVDYETLEALEDRLRQVHLGWWPRSALDYRIEERRVYPRGSLAAHLIGYTNVDGKGLDGLERRYDQLLRSQEVARRALKDGRGRVLDPQALAEEPPEFTVQLTTTLDERIQFFLEEELEAACQKTRAAGGVGIVMNPRTGAVLALANHPAFDLNAYNDPKIPTAVRRNRAIWWPYEPGSVFKVFTLAALLEEGRVRLDEPIFCENGLYQPHPRLRPIRDVHPAGWLSFEEVIVQSSNIGVLKVTSERLPLDRFREYLIRFGLDQKTGIDLPYERTGSLAALRDPSGYALYYAPWGQGISVTPLQLLVGVNALANDGVLMKPYVVAAASDPSGRRLWEASPTPIGRAVRPETARRVVQVMRRVVEEGTGRAAQLPGLSVAGKTGTSQKVSPQGGYERDAFVASFVGFFPAEDPRYSILIVIDEPQGEHYGGRVAAPVFRRVAERILQYERLEAGLASAGEHEDL
ncbi:MAG: stage V sporulation protein D [Candidatus Poribacteria bacterium]|nr:MAG: stage V sporulation protein D [Candidatus Poribacteria bacterium]